MTFDHRGVGASVGSPPYSIELWAGDTLRLMDHLKIDRAHLVGHSTGGAIAQVLAADHPDRIASLVVGGTWARPDARFRRLFEFRARVLREMGPEAYEDLGLTLTLPTGLPPDAATRQSARHASHRRAVPRDALVRLAADGAVSATQRLVCRAPSPPPADDQDGFGADLSAAEDQRTASAAQDLSVSAASPDDRPAEPGLVRRHHLHPDAARLPLSGRHHGLGDEEGSGVAVVEHDGRRLLYRGAGGGDGPASAYRRSSTPIRDRNSPAPPLPRR